MNLAYKYRLIVTNENAKVLGSFFALQRKNWNVFVDTSLKMYENNKDLEIKSKVSDWLKAGRRVYTDLRKLPENAWMNEVLSNHRYVDYVQQAVQAAWQKYFDNLKKGELKKRQDEYRERCKLTGRVFNKKRYDAICKPKFKSRFDTQSYTCDFKGGLKSIDLQNGIVYLNAAKNTVLDIPFIIKRDDKIYAEEIEKFSKITISKDNTNSYYISIAFESNREIVTDEDLTKAIGIDMGCKTYAVLSDETSYEMPDTSRIDKQIENLQQKLSNKYLLNKDTEGWEKKNWKKVKLKIAKLHKKKANIRSQATHKFTNEVTDKYTIIGIEDLNVKGMTKEAKPKLGEDGKTFVRNNKKQKAGLNRSILDKNFFETGRQLAYKAEWKGKKVIKVGRFFASSKICNHCGHKFEGLLLSHREWVCDECACVNDRDLNASKNIRDEALRKLGIEK